MLDIPMRSRDPLDRQSISSLNQIRVQAPLSSQYIQNINRPVFSENTNVTQNSRPKNTDFSNTVNVASNTVHSAHSENLDAADSRNNFNTPVTPSVQAVPQFKHTVQKGQKVALNLSGNFQQINACLGWNIKNPDCDVDVSAFLLDSNGKVPDDNWFVFYGQKQSPDGSTVLSLTHGADREAVSIDFSRLHPSVSKIVFVLTINEAQKNNLNFSMIDNAYIRILNSATNEELVSFCMDEYYSNVTSMMIGEIYRYHDTWKFNAIGNGVARDLAGLCELYGVQVENS